MEWTEWEAADNTDWGESGKNPQANSNTPLTLLHRSPLLPILYTKHERYRRSPRTSLNTLTQSWPSSQKHTSSRGGVQLRVFYKSGRCCHTVGDVGLVRVVDQAGVTGGRHEGRRGAAEDAWLAGNRHGGQRGRQARGQDDGGTCRGWGRGPHRKLERLGHKALSICPHTHKVSLNKGQSTKMKWDYLDGWIKKKTNKQKRSHTQKSHPKWWTPETKLGTQKKKNKGQTQNAAGLSPPPLPPEEHNLWQKEHQSCQKTNMPGDSNSMTSVHPATPLPLQTTDYTEG